MIFYILLGILTFETSCGTLTQTEASTPMEKLPGDLKPTHYILHLKFDTNINAQFYSGLVRITIHCIRNTKKIVLHAHKEFLTIHSESVKMYRAAPSATPSSLEIIASINYDEKNEFLCIELSQELDTGFVLDIPFVGKLSTPGLTKVKNDNKVFIASNFKRTYAHRVFPCFDEPSSVTPFQVKIERKSAAVSFSSTNWLHEQESKKSGWKIDVFRETRSLSPSQLAFAVSDIPLIMKTIENKYFSVSFWRKQDSYGIHESEEIAEHLQRSKEIDEHLKRSKEIDEHLKRSKEISEHLERSKEIAEHLESFLDYTTFPPDMPLKVNLEYVLVPGPQYVCVEEQGLIVESQDAYDGEDFENPDRSTASKQHRSYFVMDSLAKHYWAAYFQPISWSFQWLPSCLARFVFLKLQSESFYQMETLSDMISALKFDSSSATEKLNFDDKGLLVQEDSPERLAKGLVLLRMLDKILGENFHEAVKRFVIKHQYKLIQDGDFWDSVHIYLESKLPKNVHTKTVMGSWVNQEGFPIVTVNQQKNDFQKFTISQERFYGEKDRKTSAESQCWWIPLTFTTAGQLAGFQDTSNVNWLTCKNPTTPKPVLLILDTIQKNEWIIFNNQMSGLYRVNYDKANWEKLISYLNDRETIHNIPPANRAQLVNDGLTLAYYKKVDFHIAIRLVKFLKMETDPEGLIVWLSFFNSFERYKMSLRGSSKIDSTLKKFLGSILTPVYKNIYPSKDRLKKYIEENFNVDNFEIKLRIHEESCRAGVEACLKNAHGMYSDWNGGGFFRSSYIYSRFSKGLAKSVLCTTIMEQKTKPQIEAVFNKLPGLTDRSRKLFIEGFQCAAEIHAKHRILDWCTEDIKGESLKNSEEKISVFKGLLQEGDSQIVAASYLMENYNQIKRVFTKKWDPETAPGKEYSKAPELLRVMYCHLSSDHLNGIFPCKEKAVIIRRVLEENKEEFKECDGYKRDHQWLRDNEENLLSILRNNLIKQKTT